MPEDVGAAEEVVRRWQERAAEKTQKFDAMRSRGEQIAVSESSRDGAVRVTVGSNGMLQGLELAESAGNRLMATLSVEIMRTLRVAQSRIPELMQQAVAETVGTEDTAAQHILGEVRRNFPEAPEDDEEPAAGGRSIQEMRVGGRGRLRAAAAAQLTAAGGATRTSTTPRRGPSVPRASSAEGPRTSRTTTSAAARSCAERWAFTGGAGAWPSR